MKTEHQRSAGGLVVRDAQILLIATQAGRWQLPKGHIEDGETPEQAAVREVFEETGVRGRVVAPLPGIEYWFIERGPRRIHKRVSYFLLTYVSGDAANYAADEVAGASWFSWDEGLAKLSFDNERQAVEAARRIALSEAR